jgi:hypothetical protein
MVLRQCSWARFTRGKTAVPKLTLSCCLFALCLARLVDADAADSPDGIQLELSPRICTMAADDKQCRTQVHAAWKSGREMSVCLIVVNRPDLKHCWEHAVEGSISVDLLGAEDVTFEIQEADRRQILASEVMRVVRESVRYRHRRRQAWSLFE